MRLGIARLFSVVLCLLSAVTLSSAQQQGSSSTETTVPRLVRISGTFTPADHMPAAPVETIALALYADETGGTPLWQETQYVTVDAEGRYTLLLGATLADGLPLDLFASGEARWLGRRFERTGEGEQARVLLASVPYALKSSDADTLGGRPPSAYLLADADAVGGGNATSGATKHGKVADTTSASDVQALTAGNANIIGKFVNGTDLGNSAMYEAGGLVGVNTAAPLDVMHVRFANSGGTMTGYAVQNLGNTSGAYSGMLFYDQFGNLGQFQGFNNFTHEYRINNIAFGGSINFMLGSNSKFLVRADGEIEIAGGIREKNGQRFLHNFGTSNTFLGVNAGNGTMTGASNSAFGATALFNNTSGFGNTANGSNALFLNSSGDNNTAHGFLSLDSNTSGSFNTASGGQSLTSNTIGSDNTASGNVALLNNTIGSDNTAIGSGAMFSNTTGLSNTASGKSALAGNTTGDQNVAVGALAGLNATTGPFNIYLGAGVQGVAGESNTMYLGGANQTRAFIGGVRGRTTAVNDAIPVMIDSAGQLGTVSSSRRFKEDIHDMGDASRALLALRPVTFRYAQPYSNGAKPIQYGLVAEEVAEVFPELAVRNGEGGVDTVHYETLSVLLLNEVQRQQVALQRQQERIELQQQQNAVQQQRIAQQYRQHDQLQQRIETLERRLDAFLEKPE